MNDADFDDAYRKPVYFRSPFLEFKDTILNEVGLDLANPVKSPRVIKTHLPVQLMPKQVQEKNCKVSNSFKHSEKDQRCTFCLISFMACNVPYQIRHGEVQNDLKMCQNIQTVSR